MGVLAGATELVRAVGIEEVAGIPNVGVFAGAENTTCGDRLGRGVTAAGNYFDVGVVLLVNGVKAVVVFAIGHRGVVVFVIGLTKSGSGGRRGLGEGVLKVVDEVAADLVDGLDGVTFAVDGDDFVGNEGDSDEENGNEGDGEREFDERETFFCIVASRLRITILA